MRSRVSIALVLPCFLLLTGLAWAKKPTSAFLRQRQSRLKQTARTLHQAGIPGYAVTYTRTSNKVRQEDRNGEMLIAAVDRGSVNNWYNKIGKHSIGFQTSAGCNAQGASSGYVRVGDEFMSYNWVRGSSWGNEPITSKESTLTEVTYLVTPQEMKAFKAFYHARNLSLIKDGGGQAINPGWVNPGRSNLKTEGCAGAASSALNPAWVKYFRRNLQAIKAHGRANNIQVLADAPDNAAQLIQSFIDRVGARQQTDPRTLVRHHATTGDLLTLFNQDLGSDPKQTLEWNRKVHWYTSYRTGRRYRDRNYPNWNSMGYNHTIFDLAPGERAKSTWNARRMSLTDFAGGL